MSNEFSERDWRIYFFLEKIKSKLEKRSISQSYRDKLELFLLHCMVSDTVNIKFKYFDNILIKLENPIYS